MNNQWFSKVAVWLVIALVLFTVFKQFDRGVSSAGSIGYSEFLEEVRNKRIKSVVLQEGGGGSTEIRARTTHRTNATEMTAPRSPTRGNRTQFNPVMRRIPVTLILSTEVCLSAL